MVQYPAMNDYLPPTKKQLGQHWLSDEDALEAMCTAAHVNSGDVVVEIGPGAGTLTQKLLDHGAEVWAVEFDESLIRPLQKRFSSHDSTQFHVQQADIRTYDWSNASPGYKVVANIPYYLTSHLIRVISETSNPPAVAVLLVQKEVAQRVAAKPGDMSLLSVVAQYYWQVSTAEEVPARLFTPPPKVDSQILVLKKPSSPQFENTDTKQFFRVVKAGFAARRKTLLNSLAGGLRMEKPACEAMIIAAGLEPTVRPQELTLQQWKQLAEQLPSPVSN